MQATKMQAASDKLTRITSRYEVSVSISHSDGRYVVDVEDVRLDTTTRYKNADLEAALDEVLLDLIADHGER